ncbi:MAG TPA: PaaI family thioesterase [Chitinophagales bacterium]|nr:PaaI family thioesterase [Chitinophagales bacterium]
MKKWQSRNPKFKEYTEFKISKNKFIGWLGFNITKIEPGYTEGEMDFKEMHEQQNGWLHGGITSAILDMVEGFAAYSMVEEGQQVFTVDARISYFNPGIAQKFFARGFVVKPGKRFHFCEGEVYYIKEGEEVIVAKGSATMAVV